MRCPMCLGKGYATDEDIKEYPHRCPNCNGKGFYSVDWKQFRCEVCNGSGKKPQTNEEWIKSANTEQLAEFLMRKARFFELAQLRLNSVEFVIEWLKGVHKE